jgi:hypothetical protein
MALSELAALDAAYQALRSLDPAGRRRALQWLSDALAGDAPLSSIPGDGEPTPATAASSRRAGHRNTQHPRRRTGAGGPATASTGLRRDRRHRPGGGRCPHPGPPIRPTERCRRRQTGNSDPARSPAGAARTGGCLPPTR